MRTCEPNLPTIFTGNVDILEQNPNKKVHLGFYCEKHTIEKYEHYASSKLAHRRFWSFLILDV